RVYGIIFDRVAGTDHFRLLKPRNRSYHGFLHVDRHAGRHAVHVYFVRVQPFRFEKNLVPRLVRKLDDLILDRRAIARSGALDLTAIQRRAGNAFLQDSTRLVSRVGYVALHLWPVDLLRHEGERRRLWITWLGLEPAPVDRAPIQARWRTRL